MTNPKGKPSLDYEREIEATAIRALACESTALSTISAEHEELFAKLRKLWLAYIYLAARSTPSWGIKVLFAKISNCITSIHTLLLMGYPGPATMVLRTLFEAHVHLEIILEKDTVARSKLFENFIHFEMANAGATANMPDEAKKQYEENCKAVRDQYHPTVPHSWCWKIVKSKDKRGRHFKNPSMQDLSEYIGSLKYYKDIYGRFSIAIHTGPMYGAWIDRGDGTLELGPMCSSSLIAPLGELTLALGVVSFLDVVRFLNPPDAKDLSMYVRREFPPEKSA